MLSRMPRLASSGLNHHHRNRNRFATALLAWSCTSARHCYSCFPATPSNFLTLQSKHSGARAGVRASALFHRCGGARPPVPPKRTTTAMSFASSSPLPADIDADVDAIYESADPILGTFVALLEKHELDAYLVPSDDPHLSEYVPAAYMRRAFLTNFHGSAGTALVPREPGKKALLWTDSRYFNEATLSLNPNSWILMKSGTPKVPTISDFLVELALNHYQKKGTPLRVGIDPYVHSAVFVEDLQHAFQEAALELPKTDTQKTPLIADLDSSLPNLVDEVWAATHSRPAVPTSPFRVHPMKYAGMKVQDKVRNVREEMKRKKATLSVFSALDDVAYLLNIRAMGDVETCPVGIAYATVPVDENDNVVLYCHPKKIISNEVKQYLQEANVTVQPYENIVKDVETYCRSHRSNSINTNKVWIDKSRTNHALCAVIPGHMMLDSQNAIVPMKACKNDVELEGMRQAHLVDGAAMAKFMAWLEHTIVVEEKSVSEVEIDLVLTAERAKQPGFLEVSFPTIAGVGSNGAIIHYRAQEGTDLLKYMTKDTPVLIDSGGQYMYGTTDITRTWHFGKEVAQDFIDAYTRVLKGHINVDTMVFPEKTPGFVLDVFARKALWDVGKDYGHGTGHGVGAALNVHEGPHSITPRWTNTEVLKRGMVTSNEPGYYEDGKYGIRIENLMEIVHVKPEGDVLKSTGKVFLKFVKLTMFPIQKNLINLDLMTETELDWLDEYHETVFDKVSPLLEEGSAAITWLEKACKKILRE